MAALFTAGMLAYYAIFLRKKPNNSKDIARLLWLTYFALGCVALLVGLTGVFEPVFEPNYPAVLFLLCCIVIGITGFVGFRSQDVNDVVSSIRGQGLIEGVLLSLQGFSIAFFLPFALSSFAGDAGTNRLELSSKIEILASYGLTNTIAGMGSHLFMVSLVMAFIRLSQPKGEGYSLPRAVLLVFASLSYVIYVLAYVGRDGSIYWLMTALLVFIVFRMEIPAKLRRWIVVVGGSLCGLVLLPIISITVARFASSEYGIAGSLWEYYGAQINNFSDYASIDRPVTYGAMTFPLFWEPICPIVSSTSCSDWESIRPFIIDVYFAQGTAPWLFGTYVSDFVADFGYEISIIALTLFSFLCYRTCVGRDGRGRMSPSRLILVLFFFLIPYWGVFYFRFGIINSFLLINLLFIAFIWLVQSVSAPRTMRRGDAAAPAFKLGDAGSSSLS